MNKKFLAVLLTLGLLFSSFPVSAVANPAASDIEGHWAKSSIEALHSQGIMSGNGSGSFRPDDAISEAELKTLLDRAFQFRGSIESEKAKVSREAAAVLFGEAAGLSSGESNTSDSTFCDSAQISASNKAMVFAVIEKAYMVGSGNCFLPDAFITRAETATVISTILTDKRYEAEVARLLEETPKYDLAYTSSLKGGFTDTIESYASAEGLTIEDFKVLCAKAALDLSPSQLTKMNAIREKQLKPTPDTLMQKVITTYELNKYLAGEYKTPKGFISVAADVKQYKNVADCYYGLRLDYEGSYFKGDDESYAVIRFKAKNIEKSIVPRSPVNGGTYEDPYPFGGVGYTTGTKGRWGSPEWVMPEFTVLYDGAQLFELYQDGREELRGIYSESEGRFLAI